MPGSYPVQYEAPEGFSPILAGAVLHGEVHYCELYGELLLLAQQGVIDIRVMLSGSSGQAPDCTLSVVRTDLEKLPISQQEIIRFFFAESDQVNMSEVSLNALIQLLGDLYDLGHQDLIESNMSQIKDSSHSVARWIYIGCGFLGVVALVSFLIGQKYTAAILLFLIAGLMTWSAVSKGGGTRREGRQYRDKILGFQEYLESVEDAKYEFFSNPRKSDFVVYENLPYATAFRIEMMWIEFFDEVLGREKYGVVQGDSQGYKFY